MNKKGFGVIAMIVVVLIVLGAVWYFKPSLVPSSETYCTKNGTNSKLALSEAKSIAAANSECANLSATNENWCDEERGLWRLGLNVSDVEMCFGAECLINVETKQTEILWMCGGLLPAA